MDFNDLTHIIVTHFHPDDASDIPFLLITMWLMERQCLLNIHGMPYTFDRVGMLIDLYNWPEWPGFFPVVFYRIPSKGYGQGWTGCFTKLKELLFDLFLCQADEVARKAKVGNLYLIHYPTGKLSSGNHVVRVCFTVLGDVMLAKDFMTLGFFSTNLI